MIKRLNKLGIRGRTETIQTTALLRSARVLETCCHSHSSERPLVQTSVEKPTRSEIIILNSYLLLTRLQKLIVNS